MKAGDIVFFQSNSLISRIISRVTSSPYSHVAVAVSETHIIEANRGILSREIELSELLVPGVKVVLKRPTISEVEVAKVVESARSMIGKDYDMMSIFQWLVIILLNIPRVGFFNTPNKLYCSELIDIAFSNAGVDLIPNRSTGIVLPSELYNSTVLEDVNK